MKKITLLFFILLVYSANFYAQTEIKRDSIDIKAKQLQPDANNQTETSSQNNAEHSVKTLSPEELKKRAEFARRLQFKMPEVYTSPPIEQQTLNERFPMANDFSFASFQNLNEEFYLTGSSYQNTYPSIGAIRSTSLNLHYEPSDWIGIMGGMYGAKFNAYGQHYNDTGFDLSLRVKVHDRIYLRAHGRYSINTFDRRNYGPMEMNMFPQTYFGAGAEFKISDSFGIEGGFIREFNPMRRKWSTIPYIFPVFYRNGGR